MRPIVTPAKYVRGFGRAGLVSHPHEGGGEHSIFVWTPEARG